MKINVLVVEDDDDLRETVCFYLQRAGLEVVGVADAGAIPADVSQFAVMVLDINLPDESGFSIAARLHQTTEVGIILLTARGTVDDRLLGLSVGADDYVVKPADLRELELRVRNLAQRVRVGKGAGAAAGTKLHAPPDGEAWAFNHSTWRLLPPDSGEGILLTATEYHLLEALMQRSGEPVPREELLDAVGRANIPDYSRNLDVTVSRLRRKVQETCGERLPVISVRGVGYVFTAPARCG